MSLKQELNIRMLVAMNVHLGFLARRSLNSIISQFVHQ
jgi:hypothetical protein